MDAERNFQQLQAWCLLEIVLSLPIYKKLQSNPSSIRAFKDMK